jgi:Mce-associated membrane protein
MADEPAEPGNEAVMPEEAEAATGLDGDETVDETTDAESAPVKRARSHVQLALIVGTVIVVALGALTGWLGYRAYQSREAAQLQSLILGVGRQGALNLTTIDAAEAEKDVQRILDSATDAFYDDFAKRSQPFIEVVKQAQSKSVGEVTEAGLESISGNEGQVLVAVTVTTSNRGAPNQPKRAWRMRLTVKKTGADEAKVSKVEFVP